MYGIYDPIQDMKTIMQRVECFIIGIRTLNGTYQCVDFPKLTLVLHI